MPLTLPAVLAAFFNASNRGDAASVAVCFTADAVVLDEGVERRGAAAIIAWQQHSEQQYAPRATPLALADSGDEQVVQARVEGNFPGSPLLLQFYFTCVDAGIAALEVRA
jgi:ketosteroid isomerase-like protein